MDSSFSEGALMMPTLTAQATTAPTATATQPVSTATHASSSVTHGTPLLGGPISDFIGKYGQPNADSQLSNGSYNFALYGQSKDDLSITTKGTRAMNILENSPTDQGWSVNQSIGVCLAFAPSDSVYKRS